MPDLAMLDYFYGDEAEQFTFYRIPKVLFTDPSYRRISSDAKILYGLMLDRMGLSVRNGWLDEYNRVFIFFTLEDALEYLCCGHTKAVSLFGELDKAGLIERKKQGQGKPTKIYVKNFVRNTIDFSCSMHYNPFVYLHSETDILTLVTVIMTNTQGEAKGGDGFWEKAEALLYQALIAYIYYEAPAEERNMNTLLDMLNACECREDDENFKSAVDLLFEQLEQRNPDHFAARQYKKFKMAAGDICSK